MQLSIVAGFEEDPKMKPLAVDNYIGQNFVIQRETSHAI